MREPNLVQPPQLNFEVQTPSSRRAGIIGDVATFWHRGIAFALENQSNTSLSSPLDGGEALAMLEGLGPL